MMDSISKEQTELKIMTYKPMSVNVTVWEESSNVFSTHNIPAASVFLGPDYSVSVILDFESDIWASEDKWADILTAWVKANADDFESFPCFCHLSSYQVQLDNLAYLPAVSCR
jgi:hypothetical protein